MCKIHPFSFGGVGGEAVFPVFPTGRVATPGTYMQTNLLARLGGKVVMSEPPGEEGEGVGDGVLMLLCPAYRTAAKKAWGNML